MKIDRDTAAFLILCVIWGSTWIGVKVGVDAVPPLFFAGSRFFAAGALILVVSARNRPFPTIVAADWLRLLTVSLLMITLCYGALFWGMLYVDSGTAAVVELSLTPVALLGFALALGEEAFDRRRLLALALGTGGLLILFGPDAYTGWSGEQENYAMKLWGTLAVASAAFTYGWGSVLARSLFKTYPPAFLSGLTTLVGGAVLLAISLAFEPEAAQALSGNWGLPAWAAWLFLVVFGSFVAYSIYMRLLRDIGPSRSGSYAFVSPVIAVVLGVLIEGEKVSIVDVTGMVIMLAGAFFALRPSESEQTG